MVCGTYAFLGEMFMYKRAIGATECTFDSGGGGSNGYLGNAQMNRDIFSVGLPLPTRSGNVNIPNKLLARANWQNFHLICKEFDCAHCQVLHGHRDITLLQW